MVNANDLPRTSNILMVKGVRFANVFDKKLKFEKINLSGLKKLNAIAGYKKFNDWLSDGKPSITNIAKYDAYVAKSWDQGFETYDLDLDIRSKVEQGAKYVYTLGFSVQAHATGILLPHYHTATFYDSNNSIPSEDVEEEHYTKISTIAKDENVLVNSTSDMLIIEEIADIASIANLGYYRMFICSLSNTGPFEVSNTGTFYYPNTAITEPIVYLIYEQ